MKPCKTVSFVEPTIKTYRAFASRLVGVTGHRTATATNTGIAPSESASLGVVVKKLAQTLRGKINLAHAVAPHMQWFGKWSPTVSAAGLCAF